MVTDEHRARVAEVIARADAVLSAPRPNPDAARKAEEEWRQARAYEAQRQAWEASLEAPRLPAPAPQKRAEASSNSPAGQRIDMAAIEAEVAGMTPEQVGLYQAVLDKLVTGTALESGEEPRKGQVLAAITALKQICNHPAAYQADDRPLAGRSGKLTRLEEIVDAVFAAGERVLVFTHFASWGVRLAEHLTEHTGVPVACYHGGLARGAVRGRRRRPDHRRGGRRVVRRALARRDRGQVGQVGGEHGR